MALNPEIRDEGDEVVGYRDGFSHAGDVPGFAPGGDPPTPPVMTFLPGIIWWAADVIALVTASRVETVLVGATSTRIVDQTFINVLAGSGDGFKYVTKIVITKVCIIRLLYPTLFKH